MKKNKKKESIILCMKYGSSCAFCPRNSKCEQETIVPKQEVKGKVLKLEVKR